MKRVIMIVTIPRIYIVTIRLQTLAPYTILKVIIEKLTLYIVAHILIDPIKLLSVCMCLLEKLYLFETMTISKPSTSSVRIVNIFVTRRHYDQFV